MNIFKIIFCRHKDLRFIGNIYGDLINECGGKRSAWKCKKCGWLVYKPNLVGNTSKSYNRYLSEVSDNAQ
jgi:hypothetical protein